MPTDPAHRRAAPGLYWLELAAWLRRQRWLRSLYARLPLRVREGVARWLARRARNGLRFPRTARWSEPVMPASSGGARAPATDVSGLSGVNVLGYVRGQFGLGEGVRAYARALIDAGIAVSLYDLALDDAHACNDHSLDAWISDRLPYRISLVFFHPDHWPQAMEQIGRARLQGHYLIACWFWELERIPAAWAPALDAVDEFIVATGFIGRAFAGATTKPITHIPFPMAPADCSALQRADFGLEDGTFVFLVTFDFNSYVARKNPQAAIQAFRAAFPPGRNDVRLLIKSSGGVPGSAQMDSVLQQAAGDARITLRDDVIERAHLGALQRCCDAYVSLHRAEGLGLGLAECMALGKPVIATAWSGNMDYMDAHNSCLVGYRLVPVQADAYHQPDGGGPDPVQHWAEPDIGQAADWMRRLVDEPGLAQQIGRQARQVREQLSVQRAGQALTARLSALAGAEAAGPAQGQVGP